VVLGEKSDLGLCQLADSTADRLRISSRGGVTVQPAKSPAVYYGHLAARRDRYAVPSELKFTDTSYASRSVYICLWTDLQQECPDIHYQIAVGNNQLTNVFAFGHLHNPRTKIRSVGGMKEFNAWLEGRSNIFPTTLDTRGANVYVFFSDNFLEMFPTNYRHVFSRIKDIVGRESFLRFSYASRHPISYNALQSYSFPPISNLLSQRIPHRSYNLNILCNVQRQDYAENLASSKFVVRLIAHSSLLRADQPMNELVIAQKTPAEDNANLAFLDKFQDYKTATNPIFISEFSNRLQLMHPHMLVLYTLALLSWPTALSQKILPLCTNLKLTESQRSILFKKTHTQLLGDLMLGFDNDVLRTSIIRSLAMGCPDLIEDLRTNLLKYTVIPGSAFNINKAKAMLQYITTSLEHTPDGEYYEFPTADAATTTTSLVSMNGVSDRARVPNISDSIWSIDCEFVRHSISLRGHIHEINNKLRLSWCKMAPESS
jgi:hypothetical protein